jgi:hypothetical protein
LICINLLSDLGILIIMRQLKRSRPMEQTVTREMLEIWLGIEEPALTDLAKRGVAVCVDFDRFELQASIARYCQRMTSPPMQRPLKQDPDAVSIRAKRHGAVTFPHTLAKSRRDFRRGADA